MLAADADRVPADADSKIVCTFTLDHNHGDAAGWKFVAPGKRQRVEDRVTDRAFIARAVHVFLATLAKIHNVPPIPSEVLRLSVETKPHGGTYHDAYEPITDDVRKAHGLARPAHAPAVLWTPPPAPTESRAGGLLDRALGLYGLTADGAVVPSDVEELETNASALLCPAGGFTCPAGVQHPEGTRARIVVKAGHTAFTCLGPQRTELHGFGTHCCVDRRGPVPPPLFSLKADVVLPCTVQDSVERAAPLPLPHLLSWAKSGYAARRTFMPVGLRCRCGSGKTFVVMRVARDFLHRYPNGRVVYASASVTLVEVIWERLRADFPDEEVLIYSINVEAERQRLHCAKIVSVCTSSLARCIGDSSSVPTLLILDEPESTVGMLNTLGGIAGVHRVVGALASCAADPFLCMLLDSHLNTGSAALVKAAGFPRMFVLEGDSVPCRNFECEIIVPVQRVAASRRKATIVCVGSYAGHLAAVDARAGLGVWMPCANKNDVHANNNALRHELGDSAEIHTLTSEDSAEHIAHVVAIFKGPHQTGGKVQDKPGLPGGPPCQTSSAEPAPLRPCSRATCTWTRWSSRRTWRSSTARSRA